LRICLILGAAWNEAFPGRLDYVLIFPEWR
jgi:hypothetical protein